MSSDVQGLTIAPCRGLEEVKEASDETENAPLSMDCNSAPERYVLCGYFVSLENSTF